MGRGPAHLPDRPRDSRGAQTAERDDGRRRRARRGDRTDGLERALGESCRSPRDARAGAPSRRRARLPHEHVSEESADRTHRKHHSGDPRPGDRLLQPPRQPHHGRGGASRLGRRDRADRRAPRERARDPVRGPTPALGRTHLPAPRPRTRRRAPPHRQRPSRHPRRPDLPRSGRPRRDGQYRRCGPGDAVSAGSRLSPDRRHRLEPAREHRERGIAPARRLSRGAGKPRSAGARRLHRRRPGMASARRVRRHVPAALASPSRPTRSSASTTPSRSEPCTPWEPGA